MATDPAILAQLQTLWGEPVTKTTLEADGESAFVASEFLPRPTTPARLADSPATWDTEAAELIGWFQAHRGQLPIEPLDLKPGGGVCVADPALFYRALDQDIAHGPSGPRAQLGGLADDLKWLRDLFQKQNESG